MNLVTNEKTFSANVAEPDMFATPDNGSGSGIMTVQVTAHNATAGFTIWGRLSANHAWAPIKEVATAADNVLLAQVAYCPQVAITISDYAEGGAGDRIVATCFSY